MGIFFYFSFFINLFQNYFMVDKQKSDKFVTITNSAYFRRRA